MTDFLNYYNGVGILLCCVLLQQQYAVVKMTNPKQINSNFIYIAQYYKW